MSTALLVALFGLVVLVTLTSVIAYHERRMRVILEEKFESEQRHEFIDASRKMVDAFDVVLTMKFEKYFGGQPVAQPTGVEQPELPAELRALGALTDESLANIRYGLMNEHGIDQKRADEAVAEIRAQLIAEGASHL